MFIRRGITDIGSLVYGGYLNPDDGAGGAGGGDGKPGGEGDGAGESKSKVTFTDEQQAEINRIVAKEAKAAAEKARKAAEQARDEADAAAKRKSDDDAAAARGEFDTVRTKLEGDVKTERDRVSALTTENEALRAAVDAILDTEWKDLPDEVTEAFLGDPENPLDRLKFLPKGKALAAKLGGQNAAEGNGKNPSNAAGDRPKTEDMIAKALSAHRR